MRHRRGPDRGACPLNLRAGSPITGRMTSKVRMLLVVVAATFAIATAVWSAAEVQRWTAGKALSEASAAEAMLVAMLDQETGLRGYLQTGDERFLEPYERGRRDFELAIAQSRLGVDEDERAEGLALSAQEAVARDWQRSAAHAISLRRTRTSSDATPSDAFARKALIDRFRSANRRFKGSREAERQQRQLFAEIAAVSIAVALSALFCGVGYVTLVRPWRRIAERDRRQRRFAEAIQLTTSEQEAYDVLRRQLESSLPGSGVAVLNRNHSGDRLVTAASSPDLVVGGARDHAPRACLAIRGGKVYESDARRLAALECEICGQRPEATACVPSLVGGEVIGAVLAVRREPLRAAELDELVSTVAQAAPNVANLRNLELAERRAMTDSLTGLANARAVEDAMSRMVAHAGRTAETLTAVMLDLDHFKAINDSFGHQRGDQVLAAVGDLLSDEIRASDFAGRYGGEEFLVLLPHTSRAGGIELAEKLREGIEGLRVRGLGRRLSASFGVAALLDDAGDPNDLLRCADRALYAAKAAGRNRVVAFERSSGGGTDASGPAGADADGSAGAGDPGVTRAGG